MLKYHHLVCSLRVRASAVTSDCRVWLAGNSGPSERLMCCFVIGVCLTLLTAQLPGLGALSLLVLAVLLISLRLAIAKYVVAALVGLSWAVYVFSASIDNPFPSAYERVTIGVSGRIVGLPQIRDGNSKFKFRVEASLDPLSQTDLRVLESKLIQLSCYRCPFDIRPGQHWRFSVRLKRPHGYASWGAFDYEKYLFRHQIIAVGYVRIKEPSTLLTDQPGTYIDMLRWGIKQKLGALDAEQSIGTSIIAALAIGDKSGLTQPQRRVFQETGVSHLMAISGLHVGLVFLALGWCFRWLLWPVARMFEWVPRPHLVLIPALLGALGYAALAGFSISTQRAFIMLCVFVICRLIGRDVSLFKVLLISMTLILVWDPRSILDVGFWLSCGAVAVIALVVKRDNSPSLLRLQPRLWLGMVPLTVLFFGQVSLVSPAVNLIAVPLFCILLIPATLMGVLLMQLGMETLSHWWLKQLAGCFEWIYYFLEKLSQFPLARWYSAEWSLIQWGVVFLVVYTYLTRRRGVIVLCGLLLAGMFIDFAKFNNRKDLIVSLLDVGQGLAMVVEIDDYVLLYDTGPRYSTGFTAAEAVVLPFLRSRGIRHIDTLIISHADNDHIGGYSVVNSAFDVAQLLSSRRDKLPEAQECIAGQQWIVAGVEFSMLGPDANTPSGSNNRSCVLKIRYFDTTVLITGDIEKQVERHLVKSGADLQADVLLVPHQGSKTSSTTEFINAVKPEIALLAAGYLNHYGHPHPTVMQRYAARNIDVVSTIDNGSITLKINQNGWSRQSFRDARRRFWHHQKKPNWDR